MNDIISNLPSDKQKIIEALINKIKCEYKKDIALVVCYGSYITKTAYKKSDLDFFFIPKTKKGYKMNMQFIIDGIGYDFWPLSWQRAEQIANFEENNVSIIAEGVVVYYDKVEDIKRFNSLKQRIEEITENPDNKDILINRAEKLLSKAKSLYFNLKYLSEEYETIDAKISQILNLLINITALINSKYIKKGVYNIENEIKEYSILPKSYLDHLNSAIRNKEVKVKKELIKNMIINIEEILQKKKPKSTTKITNDNFKGFYEEIKSSYNKLIHACENKDYIKTYFTAHLIENEVKSMLGEKYDTFNFPNLIININENDFKKLKSITYQQEEVLLNILKKQKINVMNHENIDSFLDTF